jgi:hypothetical protein
MRSRAVTAAHEDRILDALKAAPKDGLSGAELAKATGLWSDPLYVALARMEHDGRLRSEWVNDPFPGRRLYHLTGLWRPPVGHPSKKLAKVSLIYIGRTLSEFFLFLS